MEIKITPEDIIKRGLWDQYVHYIVGSEKDAKELLKNNKEFILSEKNAIVIGLLKVMETDNLIYRFNDYITYIVSVKSLKEKSEQALIKKRHIEKAIDNFMTKFPDYWVAPKNYEAALIDMKRYVDDLQFTIKNGSKDHKPLETINITILNQTYECYSSNAFRKLLNFNNY
jgi:hypothetical protein